MDKIITFEKFYEIFFNNINSMQTNAKEFKDSKYGELHFHDNLRTIDDNFCIEEYNYNLNLVKTNDEIKKIGIKKHVLDDIIKLDNYYNNYSNVGFNEFEMYNVCSNYSRWSDMPTLIIHYEVNHTCKNLLLKTCFTTSNRNDGLEDWCYINSYWHYWFQPKYDSSLNDNDFYLEMIETIKEILENDK